MSNPANEKTSKQTESNSAFLNLCVHAYVGNFQSHKPDLVCMTYEHHPVMKLMSILVLKKERFTLASQSNCCSWGEQWETNVKEIK